MNRTWMIIGFFGAISPALWASDPPKPAATEPRRAAFAVTAAPEAVPAFRHRLWPDSSSRTGGNAAVIYPRAFGPEFVKARSQWPIDDRLEELLKMPLAELKALAGTPEGGVAMPMSLKDLDI